MIERVMEMENMVVYTPELYPEMQEIEYYYQFVEHRTLSPVPHRHEFYEICLMLRGWTLQTINGEEVMLSQGELVMISPEMYHAYSRQSPDYVLLGLSVQKSRFQTVAEAFGFLPEFGKKYKFSSERFTREQLFGLAGKPQQKKILLNSLLCEIFLKIAAVLPEDAPAVPAFLREGYAKLAEPEHIRGGMAFLMEYTCYSRSQLCRLTVQYYGRTPSQLITEIRMNLAREYLRNTGDTLEVIAEKIGYHSVSQLHKVFQQVYGESPGTYRKRCRCH